MMIDTSSGIAMGALRRVFGGCFHRPMSVANHLLDDHELQHIMSKSDIHTERNEMLDLCCLEGEFAGLKKFEARAFTWSERKHCRMGGVTQQRETL